MICLLRLSNLKWDIFNRVAGLSILARSGHSATQVGARIYYYGGYNFKAGLLDDLFVLNTGCVMTKPDGVVDCNRHTVASSMAFVNVQVNGPRPIPRYFIYILQL